MQRYDENYNGTIPKNKCSFIGTYKVSTKTLLTKSRYPHRLSNELFSQYLNIFFELLKENDFIFFLHLENFGASKTFTSMRNTSQRDGFLNEVNFIGLHS
jgi:hypothetical protein